MHRCTWPGCQSKYLGIMPHIPTRLVLSQQTGPQQRQVRIHFIWHIYPSPQLLSSHRCQYSRNYRPSQTKLLPSESLSTVILPSLTTPQTSVDLHIITSGHCVILGGHSVHSQMTWPRRLPLPLSTHVLITLTLSSMALQISRNYNVYKTQLLE